MPSLVVIGQQIKEKWRGGKFVPPAYILTKYPSLNRVKFDSPDSPPNEEHCICPRK